MSENKISLTSNNSYAQALFELASEDNVLSEIEKQQSVYADVYLQRGICAKNLKRFESALEDFLKAASIDNQKAEALENIGTMMVLLGDSKNGLKYLESASAIYLSQGNIEKFESVSNAIVAASAN